MIDGILWRNNLFQNGKHVKNIANKKKEYQE